MMNANDLLKSKISGAEWVPVSASVTVGLLAAGTGLWKGAMVLPILVVASLFAALIFSLIGNRKQASDILLVASMLFSCALMFRLFSFSMLPCGVAMTVAAVLLFIPIRNISIIFSALLATTLLILSATSDGNTGMWTLVFVGLTLATGVLGSLFRDSVMKLLTNQYTRLQELEAFKTNMDRNILFANDIAAGSLNTKIELDANDNLSKALLAMRANLLVGSERESHERYINSGLAELGKLIQNNNRNISGMCDKLIAFLIKYLEVNQGAFFILSSESGKELLKMTGCYAYSRKKFIDKLIEPGEGLVGQCFLEREPIYLRQVPSDYIAITSGLGEAVPSVVVLYPLMNNNQIEGVLEIASFEELPEFKLEFLERVSEAIAATIRSVRTTEHTSRLYQESAEQAEQLRAQEEEMRQNMEELSATQEEIRRYSLEMEGRLEGMNKSGISFVEMSIDGLIMAANENFAQIVGYSIEQLKGEDQWFLFDKSAMPETDYIAWMQRLRNGATAAGEFKLRSSTGEAKYIRAGYSAVLDVHQNPKKVIMFCVDITEMRQQNALLQDREEELKQSMEEMKATQEELSRKNAEAEKREQEVNKLLLEVKANEEDLQRVEQKYRELTREYLMLKKTMKSLETQ